ncbi:D-glycero-beta-D-manno-heptose-1,7-bisphosphate 7-phosphatase [Sporosarcina sp. P13]|uniref:D-glycero-alpha-D-manno-heptose-1,7-bisphosphate 7-phosphatase n=1 Tax=Sporosarcina sp. P13 TaxID=2048263 RepID=UPI000C165ED4|nr:HAD family hydrolase [Sporosarcina sp. P13]PIC64878.1 D-glycero-beta-D-manno-heptose-1,7-bisphosphate 7-phosphatase [Sporosarcina sp. P13]
MKKAVFLDRDGVINEVLTERVKFVNEPTQLYLLPGVAEAIKQLNTVFDYVFVVTNQGGVGLGYMKESQLIKIHDHMKKVLRQEGAIIDDVVYCPHKPKAGCACRKPNSQLIDNLAKKYNVNPALSYMVGDTDTDIVAGKKARMKTVFIGNSDPLADAAFPNLQGAAEWICRDVAQSEKL